MPDVYVEKTGWEILRDFTMGRGAEIKEVAKPVAAAVKSISETFRIAYNPLRLTPGDIVLLDVDGAEEMRFEVSQLVLARRKIGEVEILTVDYQLSDPTDETVSAALRVSDAGNGKYSVLLLYPDGENAYDEELERMLNTMQPGDSTGFPRTEEVYTGFVRPAGVAFPYEVSVTEYGKGASKSPYTKSVWGFVRDESVGNPVYIFEMNGTDGYFYCHNGLPVTGDQVRAFRF